MPVVQAAIPDVCPRVELIALRWLILIDLISSVVENQNIQAEINDPLIEFIR
jgi:hypothetical protein